jgi:TRAP-type C4-dicarboxylate transport system substrate-binding protein
MMRSILRSLAVSTAIMGFSAAAYAAGPIELRFGFPNPPSSEQYTDMVKPWAEKVNKEAGDLFHVKVFVGSSLVNMHNTLDRVETGVVNMGFCVLGPVSSQFPKTLVATLPSVARDAHEAGLALQHLYEGGIISDEWQKVKPLAFIIYPELTYHTVPKVKTLADLKGLKISVQGRIAGEALEALGGVPITIPTDELYEALHRGTIQGSALGWPGVTGLHLTDIVKNHVLEPLGATEVAVIMNNATYDRLPAKAKQVIDANSGTVFTNQFNDFIDRNTKESIDTIKRMKDQAVTPLSPAERALWMKRIDPVIAAWEKRTPDGPRVLTAFRKEIAAIRSGS